MTKKLSRRFEELQTQLEQVFATKHYKSGGFIDGDFVDDQKYIGWILKAKNLISHACGSESHHFVQFRAMEQRSTYETNHSHLLRLQAVFEAAREDFEGGYCTSLRTLVQAEVFDSELEQASSLLTSGYCSAAAVIAGVVLETALRQLCDDNNIPHGKLDKMNADLAKVGQYNVLKQKQITALADIRNSAAHGKADNFTAEDVKDMIAKVEAFLSEQLG